MRKKIRIKIILINLIATIEEILEVEEISEEIFKITWQKQEALTMIISTKAEIFKKRTNLLEITYKRWITILNKIIKTHRTQSLKQLNADILICMGHATMVINVHMHMEIMISGVETKLINMPTSHNSSNFQKGTRINKLINICSHKCRLHRIKTYLIHK